MHKHKSRDWDVLCWGGRGCDAVVGAACRGRSGWCSSTPRPARLPSPRPSRPSTSQHPTTPLAPRPHSPLCLPLLCPSFFLSLPVRVLTVGGAVVQDAGVGEDRDPRVPRYSLLPHDEDEDEDGDEDDDDEEDGDDEDDDDDEEKDSDGVDDAADDDHADDEDDEEEEEEEEEDDGDYGADGHDGDDEDGNGDDLVLEQTATLRVVVVG
eukprot:3938922-Rhodomonas_salina.2